MTLFETTVPDLSRALTRILLASCGASLLSAGGLAAAVHAGSEAWIVLSAVALVTVTVGGTLIVAAQIARDLGRGAGRREEAAGAGDAFDPDEALQGPVMPWPVRRREAPLMPMPEPDPGPDGQSLRRAQKLEAVERLRDGIVHDLNNKLMVISANVDAVARQVKDQPALQRKLLSALVASDQAASLIARSAAFARRDDGAIRHVDLAERIDGIAALLGRSMLRDTVELRVDLEEGLWPIEVILGDLETALVILSAYARDALDQGGTITLEARNLQIRRGALSTIDLEGDFVQLTIRGGPVGEAAGPPDLGEQAFALKDLDLKPWLTLHQGLRFLDPIGGAAEIRSTEAGTSILLYLPRARVPPLPVAGANRDPPAASEPVDPNTEILVVDDEVEVALALQSMLEEFGYVTRIATNGRHAMKSLEVRRPALVLADVSMPGSMDGAMLAREIRQRHPAVPVLLITGNPAVAEDEQAYPLLHKPIVSRDLHVAIQRHLAPEEEQGKVLPFLPRPSRRTF